MRVLIVLCAVLALTGCATTSMSPEQVAAADDTTCQGYGFTPGTDAFAQCRLQIAEQHHADNVRRRQAIGAALSDMGREMRENRPVTCSSTTYGNGDRLGYNQNSTTTCF